MRKSGKREVELLVLYANCMRGNERRYDTLRLVKIMGKMQISSGGWGH